jgi:predicted aspartyl protease
MVLASCTEPGQLTSVADMHVTFVGNQPVVTGTLAGNNMRLIVDTGAAGSIITPQALQRLGITRQFGDFRLGGIGGETYSTTSFIGHVPFAVVKLADQHPPGQMPPDGLIGDEFLDQYDIALDFPQNDLRLYQRTADADVIPFQGPFARLPMSITSGGQHEFTMYIDGRPVTALLDTGASHSSVRQEALDRIGVQPAQCGRSITAVGIGDLTAHQRLCRFVAVTIGGEIFTDRALAVQDRGLNVDFDVLLGEDYLRRHEVFISNQHHALYLSSTQSPVS